jgi:acyl-CoA thioester hydrolase
LAANDINLLSLLNLLQFTSNMARVHINLPAEPVFTTELQVRVSDINYGGHVGNDSMLTLMHEARLVFYRSLGFKNEISFEGSIGQIITDAAIEYKAESFLGDYLRIQIFIGEISKYGFEMSYKITNKNTEKEIARGKTGIVCFDYEKRKVASIPAALLNMISAV